MSESSFVGIFSRVISVTGVLGVTTTCTFTSGAKADTPRVVLLPPGTEVRSSAPGGWTHLVVKSIPRLETGDIDTLPSMARTTAALFRTVITADVRTPAGGVGGFRLVRIGLGLCVPFRSTDTVVTPDDPTEARDSLGFLERQVLDRASEELRKGRVLAASSTFTLYGAPCSILTRPGHAQVLVLYGLLVDPTSGGLTTVVWTIPADSSSTLSPSALVQIPPRLVYTCGLDVAATRLLGTVPVNWAFAMRALPPGRDVLIPRESRDSFRLIGNITADPDSFERQLRTLLRQPKPADNVAR